MKNVFLSLLTLAVVGTSFGYPTDTVDVTQFAGVVYSLDGDVDTIKSATDSAVVKTLFTPPKEAKGCLWVLVQPKAYEDSTGAGGDSIKAIIRIKMYDKNNRYLGRYISTDSLKDSSMYKFVLPIETADCAADKYTIQYHGYTGSGGRVIFPKFRLLGLLPIGK